MNTLDENIMMPTNNNIELLIQMRPARNDMPVVEPVDIPIPQEPPDIIMEGVQTQDQTHNEFDNMDINIDDEMSVEAQEMEYLEEFNTDWIDDKILLITNIRN